MIKPNILVVGDLMIDHYLWGNCDRISPEAPVQIVDVNKETAVLGGAGNVVNNLIALGAKVTVIGAIGDDESGEELKAMLDNLGDAQVTLIAEKGRTTSRKTRVMAAHQQVIRYDSESKNDISQETQDKILLVFTEAIAYVDAVLLSDYGKGVLTIKLAKSLIAIANSLNKKILVDPKGENFSKYAGAYLLTPNRKEASLATKIKIDTNKTLEDAIVKLKSELNLSVSIVTLSEQGIAIFDNALSIIPAVARDVFDVTGAGDTVFAALGFMLAQGKDIYESVEFANLAAGVAVGKLGSATVSLEEIVEYRSSLHRSNFEDRIKSFEEIKKITNALRAKKKKLVFSNGCFDILHRGHVTYLKTAKSYGDVLIIGLNSDASVRSLKGADRPINNEEDRAVVLSSLECVDFVVIFDDETPYELIKLIQPDVLVKGGDYLDKEIVGSDIVKEVKVVPLVEGKSTTNLIKIMSKGN